MFRKRFKALRKARGLTQQQLAEIIGVSQSAIGKYETSTTAMPSYDILIALADYFGVSLDFLLGVSDSPLTSAPASTQAAELVQLADQLNPDGQEMLLTYARMLTGMPKYAKDGSVSAAI